MAHKKAGASAKMNRDSISKRLGVKKYGSELVKPGSIIVRQKGNRFYPGLNVRQGNDFTLYAISDGKVQFKKRVGKTIIDVV